MAVGKIYREVAKTCLDKYYPCMSKHEKEALLSRGNINEIESYVEAKKAIERGVYAIWDAVLPGDFMKVIMYDEHPENALKEARKKYVEMYYWDVERAKLALRAVREIHDNWVGSNVNKFLDESRQDKQYMFMPYWLIGFEEVLKDYDFIEPFLRELDIDPPIDGLEEAYLAEQREMLSRNCIFDHEGLKHYIANLTRHNALTFGVVMILQSNPSAVKRIAEQVEKRNDLYGS